MYRMQREVQSTEQGGRCNAPGKAWCNVLDEREKEVQCTEQSGVQCTKRERV